MNSRDDVAIAAAPLLAGQSGELDGALVAARESIPMGHKIALRAIAAGDVVRRYGEVIGRARCPIEAGARVHTHNLQFMEPTLDYEFPAEEREWGAPSTEMPVFQGYARADGRAGTRNYIAVVAASNCAAHTVSEIAASYAGAELPAHVDGIVAFPHGEGCAHSIGADTEQLHRTLAGVIDHPNVSGALIVGLGCETNQMTQYLETRARVAGFNLQSSGGTRGTVRAARAAIDALIECASAERRTALPASLLTVGLNCGGSDAFSGVTANPALGHAVDLLSGYGATSVLAETPEIFGAEHLLVRRARSRAVGERLLAMIAKYRRYLACFGGSFDDNPSPGNKEGGLSNILEKSLGAVAKGGTGVLNEVVDYAERVHGPGLVFMNTPGYDPVSLAGLGAGGVNLIAFTTGRGSAIGFPTIPVIKIATNSRTYNAMRDNMDVNAGCIAVGDATVEQLGRDLVDHILLVASGAATASERFRHREFVPWRIGPVL
jgi:altronate hydrolase